ncbi:MAG: hypothetical protein IID52_08775 [Proteobacteria bacterium]|nr:hypothetical protein [Pseudomonadota bacterium]
MGGKSVPVDVDRIDVDGAAHVVALKVMRPKPVANECAAHLAGRLLGFTVL